MSKQDFMKDGRDPMLLSMPELSCSIEQARQDSNHKTADWLEGVRFARVSLRAAGLQLRGAHD